MKKLITFFLFILIFAGLGLLEADRALGLYGILLLIYLLAKMGLSFVYRPFKGEAKSFKVAAVIPSYNEDGDGLIQTLESILVQTYPIDKIYIIDDGSPDRTGYEKVRAYVEAHPDTCSHVIVHRLAQNAGKRHAQAWAFERSDAEVFFTVDSDSYVYPTALEELIKTLNDDKVYAATGHLNARNRDDNFLTRLIDIRYDNAFRVERAAQSVMGNILTCSGPLSIYRREVIIPNLDHYLNQYFLGIKMTMGDDRCLTNYANKLGKTVYQSTARCDTDVPVNLKTFMRQQIRWNKSFFRETLVALKLGLQRPMVVFWSSLELILFVLLSYAFFNLIFNNFKVFNPTYLIYVLLGVIMSALARNIHYAVKHPLLFLLSPFYGILHLFLLQPIRMYALLTLRDVRWGTRQAKSDDTDDMGAEDTTGHVSGLMAEQTEATNQTKILVLGAGYVGLAHALLFSRNPRNQVVLADIDHQKIQKISAGQSPLEDKEIAEALAERRPNLTAVLPTAIHYNDFDAIFLCLPTNYDEVKHGFDTTVLDKVLEQILGEAGYQNLLIIKSTLPVGYTQSILDRYGVNNLIFSPEFLREGQALKDNLYPSRLVFGTSREEVTSLSQLYLEVIEDKTAPILVMSPSEAESVKLFSNTYLAMRVAFFNELDSFAEAQGLSSARIIKAVGLDERIGRFYNNPSFGYGGYCLPKDSKQLRSNFEDLPADLIDGIVTSNDRRKAFITEQILATGAQRIGVYRLSMKQASDNSRESAILDIMVNLQAAGRELFVYEPKMMPIQSEDSFYSMTDLADFKAKAELILANRWDDELTDVVDKVYTRDIFKMD